MTPSATVWTIFFVHIGIVLVATSYFALSAALAPRIAHRARMRFAQRPWLPMLIGVFISLPWVVLALVLMNQPIAGLKFAGAVAGSAWVLVGLIGGAVGCVLSLPFNGVRAGTMNFQTFTEMAFSFRVTPFVLGIAISFALMLGLFGGAWPAWRAARLKPTLALRQG